MRDPHIDAFRLDAPQVIDYQLVVCVHQTQQVPVPTLPWAAFLPRKTIASTFWEPVACSPSPFGGYTYASLRGFPIGWQPV